jgi:hypothetical protein
VDKLYRKCRGIGQFNLGFACYNTLHSVLLSLLYSYKFKIIKVEFFYFCETLI